MHAAWRVRQARKVRMGGRVGGASGRAMAARAGGTWVRARVGSSGGGARAAAAAHRLARKVERMSMFTVAMVWWMMRVMSERLMTAGSRRRGHHALGRPRRACVSAMFVASFEVGVISDCMHARFYPLISRKYKRARGHFWRSVKVFQRVWLSRKLLARPGLASCWGFRTSVHFETKVYSSLQILTY